MTCVRRASVLSSLAIGSGAINTSSVYTFTRTQNTWSAPTRLKQPNVLSFGAALALQDDTMIIGAPHSNAAFIYTRGNGVWSQNTALAPANNSLYGWSVAINNGRIAVGAPLGDQGGAAYVYRQVNGAWSPSLRLDAFSAGGFGGENFAQGVALSATTLAVGAPVGGYAIPTTVTVGSSLYSEVGVGDQLRVTVSTGSLGLAWVEYGPVAATP